MVGEGMRDLVRGSFPYHGRHHNHQRGRIMRMRILTKNILFVHARLSNRVLSPRCKHKHIFVDIFHYL